MLEIDKSSDDKYVKFTVRKKVNNWKYFKIIVMIMMLMGNNMIISDIISEYNNFNINIDININIKMIINIMIIGMIIREIINKDTIIGENLLIIPTLGIQIEDLRGNKKFIPRENIKDIVINEGFKGNKVIYYMCVINRDNNNTNTNNNNNDNNNNIEVVFPNILPSINILEEVYRDTRKYISDIR